MQGEDLLEEVMEVAEELNLHIDGAFFPSITEAMEEGLAQAKAESLPLVAFGSLSYLGELKGYFLRKQE